jgi:hypothetical protein
VTPRSFRIRRSSICALLEASIKPSGVRFITTGDSDSLHRMITEGNYVNDSPQRRTMIHDGMSAGDAVARLSRDFAIVYSTPEIVSDGRKLAEMCITVN